MSYRDLRSLTEMMRALGYPRLISLENFRQPNFQLVAEMLSWLVRRFEPSADLPQEIETMDERIMFIRSVVQFMATKAHVKLHPKKLYQADGFAVKEILKVTSVLYNAMKMNTMASEKGQNGSLEEASELPTFDISSKLNELKQTRQLGSQITMKGATLYDLLGKEVDMREKRNNVLARQLEITEVEQALRSAIKGVDEEIKKVTYNIENVASNEANLEAKIEKKKVELERNQKRLQTLKKVRPAFMDEYEKMEEELRKLYEEYIVKFRCMTHLEQQIEEYERVEQEKMKERTIATRKIMERLRQDESMHQFDASSDVLSDDLDSDDDDDEDLSPGGDGPDNAKPGPGGNSKPRRGNSRPHGPVINKRVYGNMMGDAEDDSGSLDSDSDLILDGDGGTAGAGASGGIMDSDDEDDDDELEVNVNEMAAETLKNRKSAKPNGSTVTAAAVNSDDDF